MDVILMFHSTPTRKLLLGTLLALTLAGPAAARADEGDEQYRLLSGLVERGLFEMAVSEARDFLRGHAAHEKAPLARYRLATALYELERRDEAVKEYRVLADREGFEYRAESAFRLGQCELDAGALDRAASAFGTVLELDQEYLFGPATFFLGETEFRRGNIADAEARYERLVSRFTDSEYVSAARRGLVWCAWEKHDLDATVARARTFLEHHSGDDSADEVRLLLGEALLEGRQPEDALRAYRSVASPELGDAGRRGAGFALAALERHGEAAAEFAALLEEHPNSRFADEARLQRGVQTLRAGDAEGALRALKVAARGDDPLALYWLGEAQEEAGDGAAALRTLERALAREPGRELAARIQVARGDLLTQLGRTQEALGAYESGGSEYALYAASVASLDADDPASAERLATTLLESSPETGYRVRALLVLGEARFAQGNHDGAREAFETVIAGECDASQRAQSLSRLGWSRYLSQDLSGAAQYFKRLIEEHPQSVPAEEGLYMLARVLFEANRPDEAVRVTDLYLRRHPDGVHRDEVLFLAARATPAPEGAQPLRELLASEPESELVPRALVELGDRLANAGEPGQAAEFYERLLAEHPGDEHADEARYGLGWCRYQSGDAAESMRLLATVGESDSADPSLRSAAWELCIWAASRAGEPESAHEAWRRFSRTTDDDQRRFDGVRTVASAWRSTERLDRGQAALEEFLSLTEDGTWQAKALVEGAYLSLESGDVDRAEREVALARRRAENDPVTLEASFFVGEARFTAGEDSRAIPLYEEAVREGSPVRADALYKLGFARMRSQDFEGAARAFDALVQDHRQHELWGESVFLLGESYFRLTQLERAGQAFERLLRDAPEHEVRPKALFRLGVVAGMLERWDRAEAVLTMLARESPDFGNLGEAELWRGRSLAAQGKRRAARQAFDRVVERDKGELAAQARIGIGRLLEDEGRTEDALAEYFKVAFLYAHEEEVAEALYRAGTCLEAMGDVENALEQYREVVEEHPKTRFAETAQKGISRLRS